MKKKKHGFIKFLLLFFVIVLLALGGFAFYVYRMVNDFDKYADRVIDYESELARYEGTRFEDFITYDKINNLFLYEVPEVYFYKYINKESMASFLALPEDFSVEEVGVEPDLPNKKVRIILGIRYDKYVPIHFGLTIDRDLVLPADEKKAELRFNDYYLINDRIMEEAQKYIQPEKGALMFTHEFPTFVVYYQMPTFKPHYVSDLRTEDGFIKAAYDIKGALTEYKEEQYDQNSLEQKLDAVWLEARQSNLKLIY